jgi:RND family efflux transporter MFP subunit
MIQWLTLGAVVLIVSACPYYVLDEELPAIGPRNSGALESADPPDVSVRAPDASSPSTVGSIRRERAAQADGWYAVERGSVALYIPTMGNLRARQTSRLASQVGGRIQAVMVDIGDRVVPGQALVRLDPAFYDIEVRQREAEVEVARVGLTDAELLLERLSGLWNGGVDSVISHQTLDESQAKRDAAEARVRQAQEALKYSQERLAETVVKAPYAGLITGRFVDPGELVATNPVTALVELQEMQVLELIFTLPQESMGLVETGTPVQFRVSGLPDHLGRGTVDKVYPRLDEATRSFTSRAWIDNSNLTYMPGMLAEVEVLAGQVEDALTVPRRALSKVDDGWAVMVQRDGHPTLRDVQVGLISMDRAEIIQGLMEGDRVLAPQAHL